MHTAARGPEGNIASNVASPPGKGAGGDLDLPLTRRRLGLVGKPYLSDMGRETNAVPRPGEPLGGATVESSSDKSPGPRCPWGLSDGPGGEIDTKACRKKILILQGKPHSLAGFQ